MDKIENMINILNNLDKSDIITRVNIIKELNSLIDAEKDKINDILQSDNYTPYCHEKYKKYSIDDLILKSHETPKIENNIMIYQTVSYKINEIINELFETDMSSAERSASEGSASEESASEGSISSEEH